MQTLQHDNLILVRMGEITLKGLNRGKFEQRLIKNIKNRLRNLGHFNIEQSQSRIWVEPNNPDQNLDEVITRIVEVFGLVSASPVRRFQGDWDILQQQAAAYVGELLEDGRPRTFKVESKRGNKLFPLRSPQICEELGGLLLQTFPDQLTVDVHQPDFILYVEIRDAIYLYHTIVKAHKGLPVGMGGRGLLLLSGGIDSPVAGYMMASRGMEIEAIYFHTFPFTSDQAKEKVIELSRILTRFTGRIRLHVVDFTEIQLQIRDFCPADMMTIVMRRMMMRIASKLAEQRYCKALITGESLGQVASQTMDALCTTDGVVPQPVFRPLIGLDKDDTVQIARRIGTFETSILPFEDCCTVFVAKHPKTHPTLEETVKAEEPLDVDALTELGLAKIEVITL